MTAPTHFPTVWGILLAAGQGSRFARMRPGQDKLLQPLPQGQSVLQRSTLALARHCAVTLVVTRPQQHQRQAHIGRAHAEITAPFTTSSAPIIHLLASPAGRHGMGASLAAAVRALSQHAQHTTQQPDLILVALADMPSIQASTYQAVLDHCAALIKAPHSPHDSQSAQQWIAAPFYERQRGHPVAFSWSLRSKLSTLTGDQGARPLLQRYGCHPVTVSDPAVLQDIDTPEQLQALLTQ